ncbi:hypothetical protein RC083_02740 [Pseudoalteromonas haloplanktis]|uniref:Uncharacterized protein n=1 Tax=Pseudoalteromonas haloplanktis TaxID=228 RepID=A0ABU1B854_PSEHA|nr:hypothetical protein [Pseudoalteromonas haloplanktis]MDQ9090506.1 hypothetical protein [Pseudoalteromonas haloplanktis]
MSDDALGLSNLHDWVKNVGWLSGEATPPNKSTTSQAVYIYNAQPIMSDDAFGLSNLHDWVKNVGWLSDEVTPPNINK